MHPQELKKGSWQCKTALCRYHAVGQQIVEEASVTRLRLLEDLIARNVKDLVLNSIAVLARKSIRVRVVPEGIEFHGEQTHGHDNEGKPASSPMRPHIIQPLVCKIRSEPETSQGSPWDAVLRQVLVVLGRSKP